MSITVTKRNGTKEPLNIEKIHKVLSWACEGITGVSVSEIAIKSHIQFYNGIKTSDIQETIIKSAADLISEETPNYQYVAGNLVNYHIRKLVFGQYKPPKLLDHLKNVIEKGFYDHSILEKYSEDEWETMNTFIDHDRDFNITYAGIEQFRGKYLVKNRVTGQLFETPQFTYILIAATLFSNEKKDRLKYVKDYYDAISTFVISLPTPIMAGVRTPEKQYSSCVLIDTGDSLDEITSTSTAIVKYVSKKAGIGINGGAIRAIKSPIRKGDATHTGVIPFWKLFNSSVKSCSQGGVRSASATIHVPIWHLEIEDLIVLKNNKGTEETRIRTMDYSIQISKLFYERFVTGKEISLFSPSDVPGLYDSFFSNQEKFEELYLKAEKSNIRKKTISAKDLFSLLIQERKDTGRIYIMNVDHCNNHSSWIEPIKMSNLCQEILSYTKPLKSIDDPNGRIGLCTLSAINWGLIKEPKDFEKPCRLAVRALDNLLDYQQYPVLAAELHTKEYRPLGVGIINFAFWLAKNDITYDDVSKEGLQKIHEFTEAWSYYLIKASVDLSQEKGSCFPTKYSKGIFPIDTYKKEVDMIVDSNYYMDWDKLKEQAKEFGIRNTTLMALMPSEASSLVSNSTSAIDPPRAFISIKQSKEGVLKQVVPGYKRYKNKYNLLWDQKSPEGYLKICAVLQKFIDQSISTNTSYNPKNYENEEIPMSEMMKHLLLSYKWGIKTLYYCNTNDGAGEIEIQFPSKETISDEEECGACKI